MKAFFKTTSFWCMISLMVLSCNKQPLTTFQKDSNGTNELGLKKKSTSLKLSNKVSKINEALLSKPKLDEFFQIINKKVSDADANNGVVPSECGPTEFDNVINNYISEFGPLEFDLYGTYAAINQLSTLIDESKQYFGANQENTKLVIKDQRNLEGFWNMPNEITIKGEHNSTLNNRDRIAQVYILFVGLPPEVAYAIADEFIAINIQSPVFIETPLLSFDAFSTFDELIVLGDGIIQVLSETGIKSDVVVSGVLSHEWGHQVQFNNFPDWYGIEFSEAVRDAEFTRRTEMEADFFSSYFLTHKRGGTYNWKNVAGFFNLFFNIGDCGFTDNNHHGTPNQRLAASRLGFIIADETLPKGYILTADELHSIFLAAFDDIIGNNISTAQALSSLPTDELRSIYREIIKHEKELKSIIDGKLHKGQIENL